MAVILKDVEEATWLVALAEVAYRTGSRRAQSLRVSAEKAHYQLLHALCRATEEEADLAEPAFTRFELRLMALLASETVLGCPGPQVA